MAEAFITRFSELEKLVSKIIPARRVTRIGVFLRRMILEIMFQIFKKEILKIYFCKVRDVNFTKGNLILI